MKIVEVIWFDTWSETDEMTKEALASLLPVPRKNIGYLIEENEKEVVLSPGPVEWSKIIGRGDTFTDSVIIARGAIQSIVVLRDD